MSSHKGIGYGDRLPPMLSYASQAEDVVLRRVFPDLTNGFYVDAGAGWPVKDSVTKYFYDKGWRGINIEPQPDLYKALVRERPRDINLQLAIGAAIDHTILHVYVDRPAWSTTDEITHQNHTKIGLHAEEIEVETKTLNSILRQHVPDNISIQFLKVDIEGQEMTALKSIDLRRWRPEVVVVEATLPGRPVPSFSWQDILLEADYKLALFDGLNRFYARDNQTKQKISVPVNNFDQYIPYKWWQLLSREAQLTFKQTHPWGVLEDNFPLTS